MTKSGHGTSRGITLWHKSHFDIIFGKLITFVNIITKVLTSTFQEIQEIGDPAMEYKSEGKMSKHCSPAQGLKKLWQGLW